MARTAAAVIEQPPRLDDKVRAAVAWYQEQTGVPVKATGMGRILDILLFVDEHGLKLEDCTLTISSDRDWPQRNVRTPEQAEAVSVGSSFTKGAGGTQHVFIHRKGESRRTCETPR